MAHGAWPGGNGEGLRYGQAAGKKDETGKPVPHNKRDALYCQLPGATP